MDPASGYTLGSSGISGGDCPIRTDGAISDSAVFKTAWLNLSHKSPEFFTYLNKSDPLLRTAGPWQGVPITTSIKSQSGMRDFQTF